MKKTLTSLFCLPFSILFSQSSDHHIIAPQGGTSQGESISVTWTIGDLVTEEAGSNDTRLTQGFQQPTITVRELDANKLQDVVSKDLNQGPQISSRSSKDFSAHVFPNPASTDITVKVENSDQEYYLDMFDTSGNLLSHSKSTHPQAVINLSRLPAAQYLLKISMIETNESKIFQITKTQ